MKCKRHGSPFLPNRNESRSNERRIIGEAERSVNFMGVRLVVDSKDTIVILSESDYIEAILRSLTRMPQDQTSRYDPNQCKYMKSKES